ncbi:hypothetical protein CYLTODRAFT_441941 [Cylindrobasidium torrendii FP15055 ss-10]|uniref:Uncharacterized protein n=1 Tax=Cylindrobasidium torrendii FP15055 ss-10 TaxID=1314674 RepID=A0A0D7BK49_9AGAR|nr:hypothetical protein CYLTODRAFT_441941 [Cylindrobasidium torrendii FP15055 ss-10]
MVKKAGRKPANGGGAPSSQPVEANDVQRNEANGKLRRLKTNIRSVSKEEDDNSALAEAPADVVPNPPAETTEERKSSKMQKSSKAAVVQSTSEDTDEQEEEDSDGESDSDDNDETYKSPKERKSRVKVLPHVRTHNELQRRVPTSTLRLVKEWSYKPGRSVDNNAILGRYGVNSQIFGRNKDPFPLLLRVSNAAGVIADVDSWMNVYQRDFTSARVTNAGLEAQCPSYGDIQVFIEHCERNEQLVKNGKKPISLMEVQGCEAGTVFTYQVVNFGRYGPVVFHVTKDGSDSTFVYYQLLLTDKTFFRKQHTHGYLTYTISAYLCVLRRQVIKDDTFWDNGTLSGEVLEGSLALYKYAEAKGWFHPLPEAEIQKLVEDGVLKSSTCRKANKFRGIHVAKRKGEEAFFSLKTSDFVQTAKVRTGQSSNDAGREVAPTKKKRARHAPDSSANDTDSPPPAKKKARRELDIPPGVVTRLPWCAQKLFSERPIRPQFKHVRIDGKDQWVLPEEWIKNPPANAHAPVEFAIANSLYPRRKVDEPGPSTTNLTLRNRTVVKAEP